MSKQFIEPIKTFLEITRENLKWAASEIQHQYFLSTLRDIEKKYPELHTEVEAFTEHLDAIFYGVTDEDCPDFVEAPERTNIQSNFAIDDPAFETEAETDAFTFSEKMEELRKNAESLVYASSKNIEDGLNEPPYPYDTEPSA
ncbi:MAG: hypothetical protein IM526_02460 [Microcystis sp. M38BS1]|uniref:hypothetical protein n=1 Tax=Microcystis sp. M38BS1 TaxID=2771188 RepID=UPI0031FC3187|nr:hypothetical protein [Microcystis sp. M38BS1]MCA6582520.1 hypothetical protein [Pseudanabaena sp. M34BS1SP1A06MG]